MACFFSLLTISLGKSHILSSLFLIWTSKRAYHLAVYFLFYTLFPFHSFHWEINYLMRPVIIRDLFVALCCRKQSPKPLVQTFLSLHSVSPALTSPHSRHDTAHSDRTVRCSLHVPSDENHFSSLHVASTAHKAQQPPTTKTSNSLPILTPPPPVQMPAFPWSFFLIFPFRSHLSPRNSQSLWYFICLQFLIT